MVKKNLTRVFLIPFFLLFAASTVHAAVVINEILPKTDPASEWIELYNTGTDQVSLNAWTLQITNGNHKTFILNASNNISSHGYLVLTEPNTGIDFDISGDTLKLIDNNNTTIDTESYPGTLGFQTSMGRIPDGANNWVICNTPATPNAANNCPVPTLTPTPTVTPVPTQSPTDTPVPTNIPDTPTSVPPSAPEVLGNAITTPAALAGTILTNTPTPTLSPDMIGIIVPKQIMISKTIAIEAAIILCAWILLAVIAHLHRNEMRKTKRPPEQPPTPII